MGVKEKAALRSPLNYRHGARARDGREGTASSKPHTGYTGRKDLVSKGYHLRGSGCHHAVLSGLASYPYRQHQVHPDWSGEVSMFFSHFHWLLLQSARNWVSYTWLQRRTASVCWCWHWAHSFARFMFKSYNMEERKGSYGFCVCACTRGHECVCANTTQNMSWTNTGLSSVYNEDYKFTEQAVTRPLASIF